MTTRHCAYVVTLERDMREDDAEGLIQAMRRLRGVLHVQPVEADEVAQHVAMMRERRRIEQALHEVVWPKRRET